MSTRSIDQILISFRHRNPVDSFLHLKSTSKSSPWFLPDAGLNQNRRRNILGFESVKTHSSKLDNKICHFLIEMVDRHWNLVEIRSKFFQLDVKNEAIQNIPFQAIQDWQFQITSISSFTLNPFSYHQYLGVAVQHYWSDTLSFDSKSTSEWSRFARKKLRIIVSCNFKAV